MGSEFRWDAEEIFKKYLHDYLVKKNMHKTAEIFAKEANADVSPVAIDSPQAFLEEWWSVFHDMYFYKQAQLEEVTSNAASNKGKQVIGTSKSGINQQGSEEHPVGSNVNYLFPQPAQRTCEALNWQCPTGDLDTNSSIISANSQKSSKLSRSSTSNPQQYSRNQAQQRQDKKRDGSLESAIINPSIYGEPKASGEENVFSGAPLKGWPLITANQIPPPIGHQVLNSYLQSSNSQPVYQALNSYMKSVNDSPRTEMPTSQRSQELYAQILADPAARAISPFPVTSNLNLLFRKGSVEKSDQDDRDVEERVLNESIEMFLSQSGGHGVCIGAPSISQQRSKKNGHTGLAISLVEVGSLHASKGKVFSCNFSPDGKLLACAGHDKKALIWNMNTLGYMSTLENHAHLVSDVRFHPSSAVFATSSFDGTLKIWDAADPSKSLHTLVGHNDHVMSLDFHPRKMDLLCSCDSTDEFRLWDFKDSTCFHVSKGAIRQVRFQPNQGELLATAVGNGVKIFDVETGQFLFDLKGHESEVRSLSWDTTGKYIVSVSEESVQLWSALSGWRCIYELNAKGNSFQSCTFHPKHPLMLVIGSYQLLSLWNPTLTSKVDAVPAHNNLIASLAASPLTGLIASGSHDPCVKLWR